MNSRQITEILVYPIKSLGGISLQKATVLPKGLQWDRRWMLVDSNNQFLTQRVHHRMALFQQELHGECLRVRVGANSVDISFVPPTGDIVQATIWDDVVEVQLVSSEIDRWFSDRLDLPCKLVFFPEKNIRSVDARYRVNDDHVSLADAYPLLIIGQESLHDLNSRLKEPVPMNRFRPNLVFGGGEPYEEDTWKSFSVGTSMFIGVKPCARCVLTTVDQSTGEKGLEPLATLSGYRKQNGKVNFGQNLIVLHHGKISVGDEVIFIQ